ncbi:hypothetical protein C7475_10170 [Chitinophaga sp. S165]|nr:hypothetical protein C7475_10170 [Chitinophaga sp. S165]
MTANQRLIIGDCPNCLPNRSQGGRKFMLLVFVLIMVFCVKDAKKWEAYCKYVGVLYLSLLGRKIKNRQ